MTLITRRRASLTGQAGCTAGLLLQLQSTHTRTHTHGQVAKHKHKHQVPVQQQAHIRRPEERSESPADPEKQRRLITSTEHQRRRAAHISPHICSKQPRLSLKPSPLLLMCRQRCTWERDREKRSSYLPHPGHSYLYADNGGPFVFLRHVTRSQPPPAHTLIHVFIRRGYAAGVRLYAGIGSINVGGYRYSSLFFSPHGAAGTWTDAAPLLAGQTQSPPTAASHDRRWFECCFFTTAAAWGGGGEKTLQCSPRYPLKQSWHILIINALYTMEHLSIILHVKNKTSWVCISRQYWSAKLLLQ